jgi:hypothetical protein
MGEFSSLSLQDAKLATNNAPAIKNSHRRYIYFIFIILLNLKDIFIFHTHSVSRKIPLESWILR